MKTDITTRQKNKTGPTIGVFISVFGGYQDAIWNGIIQVAEEHNAEMLCFVGAALNDTVRFQKHWNTVYDLASPANLDGLIMFSAALQHDATIEELSRFYARYAPLPIISIAQELEGRPSITSDNSVGFYDLLKHLIEDHHYHRIAFIRGPENNPEADIRYRIYTEVLENYGIPFEPDLVASADFGVIGPGAIRLLLDERKVNFEVVVASNDYMAIGAWQELNRRGLNVPTDVAVTGFDDIPEAQIFARPLTTVRQSLPEQGRQAAQMLFRWLRDGTQPESVVLKTELVIRESCGCLVSPALSLAASAPIIPINISEDTRIQHRDVALAEIQEVIGSPPMSVSPQSIELLVSTFFDVLQRQQNGSQFLLLFGNILRQGTMDISHAYLEEEIIVGWQKVLSILREKALTYKHPDMTEDVDELLYQGYSLIIEAVKRIHMSLESHAQTSVLAQFDVVREINTTSSSLQVADFLAQNLPVLGIGTATLALYENEPVPPSQSRLIMAIHNGQRLALAPDGQLFPSMQLIPPDILPRDQWPILTIHPLLSRDIQLGFITMEIVPDQWSMYNTYIVLAEQIGSALYRALLQQRNEQSNRELEQHAARLAQTNAQLAEANAQLEQFAYIASHDLQEPLRMVASYLQLLKRRYHDKLDDDAEEFIGYAVGGAVRMKLMLKDLLVYSRMATEGRPFKPTDCEQLLAQTLSNLEVAIQKYNALITHDPLPIVMADNTQLMGVFQNLIGNAIKFHADRQPRVHIAANRAGDEWIFSVEDNGIGIAPDYYERIFVVFSRLHTQVKYPGTGIGLAICKKVVERHGGRIWVESQSGEGSTFFFTIPTVPRAPAGVEPASKNS